MDVSNERKQVIQALQDITSDHNKGLDHQLTRLLMLGCERFNLDIGILSKIDGNAYEVMQVVCPENIELKAGDKFELSNTYCSMTMAARGTVYLEHVRESSARSHPAYQNFRLEAYIGVPVTVNDRIYGTLNFSSPNPALRKFQAIDITILQLMAKWLGTELGRQQANL